MVQETSDKRCDYFIKNKSCKYGGNKYREKD